MESEIYYVKKLADLNSLRELDISEDNYRIALESMKYRPEIVTNRVENYLERKIIRKAGLSSMNLRILFVVLALGGEALQSTLLEYLYTSAANLSQRINWLIDNKYLTVVRTKKRRRSKQVRLTEYGRTKTEEIILATQREKEKFMDHFTPEEIAIVAKVYSKMAQIMDEIEGKDDPSQDDMPASKS